MLQSVVKPSVKVIRHRTLPALSTKVTGVIRLHPQTQHWDKLTTCTGVLREASVKSPLSET